MSTESADGVEECPVSNAPGNSKSRKKEQSRTKSPVIEAQEDEQQSEREAELSEEQMEVDSGGALPTEGYWSHYQSLCQQLPGREKQIEFLLTLLGEVSPIFWPARPMQPQLGKQERRNGFS